MLEPVKLPQELQNLRQWVCWRLEQDKRSGKDTKVPYNPTTSRRASPSASKTWGTLDEALITPPVSLPRMPETCECRG